MSSYCLNLFGGFDLRDGRGAPVTIRSKKGRCLLAYLALAKGERIRRDVLAELLWGDRGDAQARRSLSQELYRLRGLFPAEIQDRFTLEAKRVGLGEGLFEVDVDRFERGLNGGGVEALKGAAALYSGEFLAGQEANQEGFDTWLGGERERLRERAVAALHEILRVRLEGPTETALESANRLLALDAASEEAHRALMQLHSRAGRRDLALKQYEKCRELLAEELGIEPDEATRALYERIKSGPGAAPQEPAPPTDDEPANAAPPPSQAAAERRQVTVMACGLILEPEARSALDPEDRREVTRICRDVAAALLERHGSRIARAMGDSFLAYFGYPEAREDDTERAARAGLEIVEAIDGLDLPTGVKARCRVGIASGLVIAGEGEEETLAGEAPDKAARLLQVAEPGSVVVSAATRELLASVFSLEALEGTDARETAWRLGGEARTESRFEAHRTGALTPFIGRELELQNLFHRWGQAEAGEGQVVLISGEPGIGKSRIAETVHERLPAGAHLRLLYQCAPHHANSALYPVIEQLNFAAGISAEEPDRTKLDKLETLITRATDDVSAGAPLFADLLSIRHVGRYPALNLSPQAQKDRTLKALVAQLLGLAAHKPVLFIFEDLHWADPTTRELLDLTVAAIEEARVLVLLTFRPEYEAPWVGQAHTTLMALTRLAKRQCGEMVRQVAAETELPEDVLNDIVAKTDGVPLFVEELTKTMVAGGSAAAVPATIQASLTARLDQLGAAREVAQIAAVIGREFSYPLLAAVAEMEENTLVARLEALTGSELVFARGAPPTASYMFKHALIRDTAYDSLLRGERQTLHGRIAEALKLRFPAIEANEPELLAHHYGHAGQAEQAIDYWRRAGERALKLSTNVEATAFFRSGILELDSIPEIEKLQRELDLQLGLGAALTATEGYGGEDMGQAFKRAKKICDETGDTERLSFALYGLWNFEFGSGNHVNSHTVAAEAVALADQAGDPLGMMLAHSTMGASLNLRGEFSSARHHLETAIDLYDEKNHSSLYLEVGEDPCINSLVQLSMALVPLGYSEQARKKGRLAVELANRIGQATSIAYAHTGHAFRRVMLGDFAATVESTISVIKISQESNIVWFLGMAEVINGWARAESGDVRSVRSDIEQGISRCEAGGSNVLRGLMFHALARSHQICGSNREAFEAVDKSILFSEETKEDLWRAESYRLKGELNRPADEDAAEECFAHAIDVAKSQEAKLYELTASMSMARLWHGQGKTDEARSLLAPVYAWFTEGFNTAYLLEAKALLAELG